MDRLLIVRLDHLSSRLVPPATGDSPPAFRTARSLPAELSEPQNGRHIERIAFTHTTRCFVLRRSGPADLLNLFDEKELCPHRGVRLEATGAAASKRLASAPIG
jgi:hypothetical protein